jgi:hypothetical protein
MAHAATLRSDSRRFAKRLHACVQALVVKRGRRRPRNDLVDQKV